LLMTSLRRHTAAPNALPCDRPGPAVAHALHSRI
jgi:hypothetical protein